MKRTSVSKLILILGVATLGAFPVHADELLSGPYQFDVVTAVHVKPAMLAGGWGMTLGGSWETVINRTVTTGVEVDADVPVVPFPSDPNQKVQLMFGGLRLGTLVGSSQVLHGMVNNTVGVGLVAEQTFLVDEFTLGAEVNVTRSIRVFATGGYRFTYGVNADRGLDDPGLRGLVLDVGLRYGELSDLR